MPKINYYTVEETRRVQVSATNPIDAMTVAAAAFEEKSVDFSIGIVTRAVEGIHIEIQKD